MHATSTATNDNANQMWNFSAGPGILPPSVLSKVQKDLLNYDGTGVSVMEMSHRSPPFERIQADAAQSIKRLLSLPDNYHVLFVQGGASLQFSAVVMNLVASLTDGPNVDYVVTGVWSDKAHQEAQRLLGKERCRLVAKADGSGALPPVQEWRWSDDRPAYIYYCDNETVNGVEFPEGTVIEHPVYKDVPLVCDVSSNFLSRPIPNIERYGVIYAGAQKNLGPAGLTVVIVRDDLLKTPRCPSMPLTMDYALQAKNNSMYNTPPTWSIYVSSLVLKWIEAQGGLEAMAKLNAEKSDRLYQAVASSGGRFVCPVDQNMKSRMNVVFRINKTNGQPDVEAEKRFASEAEKRGLVQLSGHRSVGGLRASLYNAMPLSGVDALTNFISTFQ